MDVVRSGRGLIVGFYPGIRLEGWRIITKTSIRIDDRRGQESNTVPPEYEA
jgi:hypothetical protein